jgi:phosphoribosylamine--glycine ligase
MKIALSSYAGYGAWFAAVMRMQGHSVDYYLSMNKYADVMQGIAPTPFVKFHDNRKSDENIGFPDYSKYDVSVFDLTGRERQADHSSNQTPTIGDGSTHKMLEEDRLFGIEMMENAGIDVPAWEVFTDVSTAKSFIKETKKRYVYKPNGGQDQDAGTTYVSYSDTDMLEYIDKLFLLSKGSPFILQEFKPGIEVSVEGWFNGNDFYCLNCTLEEKKFMNDGIGPNTGCSGNLVFTLNPGSRVFTEGLAKAREVLSALGYRGMIDLNTIATEEKLYGLEWTPRFGYDASATLFNMYGGDFGELLKRVATGGIPEQKWKAEYGVSARITIPPYPTEIRLAKVKGIPVKGIDINSEEELMKTYFYDVMMQGSGKSAELVCAGVNGLICCPIEVSATPQGAFAQLDARIEKIEIPDMQHRTDLQKSIMKRFFKLKEMGWI